MTSWSRGSSAMVQAGVVPIGMAAIGAVPRPDPADGACLVRPRAAEPGCACRCAAPSPDTAAATWSNSGVPTAVGFEACCRGCPGPVGAPEHPARVGKGCAPHVRSLKVDRRRRAPPRCLLRGAARRARHPAARTRLTARHRPMAVPARGATGRSVDRGHRFRGLHVRARDARVCSAGHPPRPAGTPARRGAGGRRWCAGSRRGCPTIATGGVRSGRDTIPRADARRRQVSPCASPVRPELRNATFSPRIHCENGAVPDSRD